MACKFPTASAIDLSSQEAGFPIPTNEREYFELMNFITKEANCCGKVPVIVPSDHGLTIVMKDRSEAAATHNSVPPSSNIQRVFNNFNRRSEGPRKNSGPFAMTNAVLLGLGIGTFFGAWIWYQIRKARVMI